MRWKLEDVEAALAAMQRVELKGIGATLPANWYTLVGYGLNTSFLRAFRHLYNAHLTHDLPLAGWAARCLLELSVWNTYVLASEENAKRFHDDALADAAEAIGSLPRNIDDAPNSDAAERYKVMMTEQQPAFEEQLRTASELGVSRHLEVREIAKLVGKERRYALFYRILSKLAHATAASVLLEIDNAEAETITGMLLDLGSDIVSEYANELSKRVRPAPAPASPSGPA